jgi:hypothetical protein
MKTLGGRKVWIVGVPSDGEANITTRNPATQASGPNLRCLRIRPSIKG